jgi:hypothetical protein
MLRLIFYPILNPLEAYPTLFLLFEFGFVTETLPVCLGIGDVTTDGLFLIVPGLTIFIEIIGFFI